MVRCTIWYYLYNFEKCEKHRWRSVNFRKVAGNFTKISTLSWVFFTFFKLYKWYQTAQRTTYILSYVWVRSSNKMIPIYFLRLSKVWRILHHRSVGWVHKKMLLNACTFWHFLLFFIIKIVFLSFLFVFFEEVSNFRNRILTNQKRELMVFDCQWNCMVLSATDWILRYTVRCLQAEPCQAFKIELFSKIVNSFHPVNYFRKMFDFRCFAGLWIRLCCPYIPTSSL